MSLDACAALLQKGDPDRFQSLLAAPIAARELLLPVYAYNLELARIPWLTKEPLIAEMRLQWWRDQLDADPAQSGHEVAGPLLAALHQSGADRAVFHDMAAARRQDVWGQPFEDDAGFVDYLDQTGGALAEAAGRILGAGTAAAPVLRAYGRATALAGYLRAVPTLKARGKQPLRDDSPHAVKDLAQEGLSWLSAARAQRGVISRAVRPALLQGWLAETYLKAFAQDPEACLQGDVQVSEFARRGKLLWQAFSGRW